MNQETARAIAAEQIGEGRTTADGVTPVIVDAWTQEVDLGWIFFYESKEAIETGSVLYALAGNAPVVVLRDGTVRLAGTARPLAEYLANIREEISARRHR